LEIYVAAMLDEELSTVGREPAPERLVVETGRRTGQTVIVSIDSTALGPALGGCRVKSYPSWRDGLNDALRLAAAMTEKSALAGLPYGGGKTVVPLPPDATIASLVPEDLFADIGEIVESLGGRYVTGPDIGTSPEAMSLIGRHTSHVMCRPVAEGGSGDSADATATGVIAAIDAVRRHTFADRTVAELTFAVLGVGSVGALVAAHLASAGADVIVADTNPDRVTAVQQWGARTANPGDLIGAEVDILIPAATGGILTAASVDELRCRAIVGPANNQLNRDATGDLLHARRIVWAPDFVVSAGGIIGAVSREIDRLSPEQTTTRINLIRERLAEILHEADRADTPPLRVARDRAQAILASARARARESQHSLPLR
jgi:leucine dehydrogenase